MGLNLYQLEIVRRRFVNSDPNDLKNLFKFIEDQLANNNNLDHEAKYSQSLDPLLIKKAKTNIVGIKAHELEDILAFTEGRIEISRNYDKAEIILGEIKKEEFYFREEKYTELERYIFKLKFG